MGPLWSQYTNANLNDYGEIISRINAGIAAGPDGAMWFTAYNSVIGRITTPPASP
jgi:hypothetical protein